MIQRIQSVFLFLASLAALSLFAVPFAETEDQIANNIIFADGFYNIADHPGLIGFFSAAGALALIAIFLFKNRHLQMRLTIFSAIAVILGIVFGLIYFLNNSGGLEGTEINDQFGLYIPLIALLFILLAYRYISKDEKLVKSMDRLR